MAEPIRLVYIFESPSPQDITEGREEGHAVAKMCELSDVPAISWKVGNKAELEETI